MKHSWLKSTPICSKGLFDSNKIVENSLPAIAKAVEGGYTLLLNISLTKDNQLIICDSKKSSILLTNHKKIESVTSDDKENLKLLGTDDTAPLLSEVLNFVSGKVGIIFRVPSAKNYKRIINQLIKQLALYKGKTAIVTARFKIYFYVKKLKRDYPCGIILKKNSSKYIYNAILFANTYFFKLIRPNFIICDIDNLPNIYLDDYLQSNPYSFIISKTIMDKQSFITANKYSDNYIFENYIPDNN